MVQIYFNAQFSSQRLESEQVYPSFIFSMTFSSAVSEENDYINFFTDAAQKLKFRFFLKKRYMYLDFSEQKTSHPKQNSVLLLLQNSL